MVKVHVVKNGSKPNWQMYYVDPISRRRVWRSSETTRKSEAERAAARWEAEIEAGCGKRLNTTWDEFVTRFEEEHLSGLSDKTDSAYHTAFNHVEELLKPARLASVTSDALSKLVKLLRDGGASETTIATYLRHVGTALRWAADIGLIRAAPKVPRVKPPKKEKAMRGRPITGEEFDRLVKAVPKVRPRDAAVWVHYLNGLWLSGLRLEESTIVSWDSDQPFSIDLTGKHPTFRILAEAQKARRDESLPMTPDFAEFILQTPEGQRYGRVFKLPLASNGKLRPEKVGTVVSAIGQKAGVVVNKTEGKFASAHDLRRSFGTRWARKVRPAVLQRLMRHKDIATTQKYYVALDTDDIAAEIWGTVNPNVNPSRPGAQIERDNGAEANERTRCGATS